MRAGNDPAERKPFRGASSGSGRRLAFARVGQPTYALMAPATERTTVSGAPVTAREIRIRLRNRSAAATLPEGIEAQPRSYLAQHPDVVWNDALAQIIGGQNGRDVLV